MTRNEQVKMLNDIANIVSKQNLVIEKLDNEIRSDLDQIRKEIRLIRIGHEEFDWDKEVQEIVTEEDLEEPETELIEEKV